MPRRTSSTKNRRLAIRFTGTPRNGFVSQNADNSPSLMIGHLRGAILEKSPTKIVIEAGGVGYEVLIPISTFTALPDEGSSASLRIFTHVREDALSLFG